MIFENKNYLIIGGSHGIGLEIVKRLASEGANVYAASRTKSDDLEKAGIEHLTLDIEDDDLSALEGFIPKELHGFVYCPGTINLKPFNRLKIEDFQRDLNINLLGAVKTLQAAIPALKKGGEGSVVFFSTVAALAGMNFHSSVVAAKSALQGLSLSLAAEYAPAKVRFNVIAPSLTDTRLAKNLLATDEKKKAAANRNPLKKIGSPADIASSALFLLSDKSVWITGQVLSVDGGMASLRPL
ncbi:MAG: SDR family oxidoreductase [candidate division Zixibacteria bacterium]|nr:SDR family oxidoreductase [candidate division Zixibacteria bacterium]